MTSRLILLLLVALAVLLALPLLSPPAGAEAQVSSEGGENATVMNVGVIVNSIHTFDSTTGMSSMDLFLFFRWNSSQIGSSHFEVMNGHPSYPGSIEMIANLTNGDQHEQWFHLRVDTFIVPQVRAFPFESEPLQLVIEDSTYNSSVLRYSWLTNESEVDSAAALPGWRIGDDQLVVIDHTYGYGETFSQAVLTVEITRNNLSMGLLLVFPPLIFCTVSGLSFLFTTRKEANIALRVGLGTSMLITAVLFHFGQLSLLPPRTTLTTFDDVMIAVYLFITLSLMVTTLSYIEIARLRHPEHGLLADRYGPILTLVLPVLLFLILFSI